ncbi:MAG: homoserine dehydrogenase [Planctomycetaceae bacterium]|nr:homoserine dehydrogenase [Planctomycetaceae bacterium]
MSPLKVAIIGLGTVGTGVARILTEHSDRLANRGGRRFELVRAVVRNLDKDRSITLSEGVLTDDVESVIADDSIEVAVQLVGGTDPACQIMRRLLESGKHVVTANKALLCEHGAELFALARERNRCIAFEAAVAGGVPIVAAVGQALAGNQITSINAILNGTSNFILAKMLDAGRCYEDVLREAQELGYAEADPSMDVDGTDAAQKLTILTQLAFGTPVSLDQFPRQGIDTLELEDLKYAHELGYAVKLLATSRLLEGRLEMHVQPTLVRRDEPLARVGAALNMIELVGDAVGPTWFSGAGAGQMPTASAVVADLIDIAVGRAPLTFPQLDLWGDRPPIPLQPAEEIRRRYFLRFHVEDRPHVVADIADILGRQGISLATLFQPEVPETAGNGPAVVPFVVMTHQSTEGQLRAADEEFAQLSAIHSPYIRMPVAD